MGLSSYNNYQLSKAIALFPIPVLTGIGHSTNETVAEMVCYKSAITPTELADFLLQKFHNYAEPVRRAEELIKEKAKRMMKDEKLKFDKLILDSSNSYYYANKLLKQANDRKITIHSVLHSGAFMAKL